MDAISAFHVCRERVLCNLLMSKLLVGRLGGLDPARKRVVACAVLFGLFVAVELVVLAATGQPARPVLAAALLAALVASVCFYAVSWCYDYSLFQTQTVVELSMVGEEVSSRLAAWLHRVADVRAQAVTSLVLMSLVSGTIGVILRQGDVPASYIPFLFAAANVVALGMGQPLFWALATPLVTARLLRLDPMQLGVYPLRPSQTPVLGAISRVSSAFAIWDAAVVTLFLAGLFALPPSFVRAGVAYLLVLVLAGYLATAWTFLYPQFNLGRVVQHGKQNTGLKLLGECRRLSEGLERRDKADLDRLALLNQLSEVVIKSPNSVLSFGELRSVAVSVLTPTLLAIWRGVDWPGLLHRIGILLK